MAIEHEFLRRFGLGAIGVIGAILLAYVVTMSDGRLLPLLVYSAFAAAAALALPPHVFLAAALLVFGVSTAFASPVATVGPATLYVSDLAVLLIVLRGALPRDRVRGVRALGGLPQLLFFIWLLLLIVAGIRALEANIPSASIVRGDLALFYWPLLYFGFSRVLAERALDRRVLWRNLTGVAVGFALYMFAARALNHPFEDPGLALVATSEHDVVPRNFGFASAFTIYPVLAIAAIAVMATATRDRLRWGTLASIGLVATLTTLVRGEIFSLALGILLVILLTGASVSHAGRIRTALQLAVVLIVGFLAVLAVDPKLGHAVVQRAVPFTEQAPGATANADYRFAAMGTGIDQARKHPFGSGVLDEPSLQARDIDPGYLVHSGFATLLIYTGWPGLAAGVLTLLAVIRRSFNVNELGRSPWMHPAFVGAIVMLSVYSLSAAGLMGDSWVVPLGALAIALRFNLTAEPRAHASSATK